MKPTSFLFLVVLGVALSAEAVEFRGAQLTKGGATLTITQSDGSSFNAPRIDEQDSFENPKVSVNYRYAGWVARYPNQGASYSQPLHLTVIDTSRQIHRFAGNFGMVFGWCFAEKNDAVVYRFEFPHGITPIGFEMRRIKDGKLLRHFRLAPIGSDEDEYRVIRAKAPVWTRCAQQFVNADDAQGDSRSGHGDMV